MLKKKTLLVSLFLFPIILSVVGSIFVFEASAVRSFRELGDSWHYFRQQLIWIGIGITVLFVFSAVDYHRWYAVTFPLMILTIILLFVVLLPGVGTVAGGARRWISIGFINIQPTELAKFSTILYLSSWFIHRERKRFFSFVLLLCLLMFLIFLQPDMGTAIVVFGLSTGLYFLSGIELHYLLLLLPTSFVSFLFLVNVSPYRFRRLLAFFDPSKDPLGITYHINQILISLTSGGLLGKGFGASRQKFLFLPEAHTDSIFAIIGEEVGFVGSFLLITAFMVYAYRLFQVSRFAKDRYGKLIAGGIFIFFNLQLLINLAGMVHLLPLTGVPLPFISYGGSHLIVSFALAGIMINIARQ